MKKNLLSLLLIISMALIAIEPKIIQPGAPGKPSANIDAEDAIAIAESSYTTADVAFLQGMIVHHEQALFMSELASERTNVNRLSTWLAELKHHRKTK